EKRILSSPLVGLKLIVSGGLSKIGTQVPGVLLNTKFPPTTYNHIHSTNHQRSHDNLHYQAKRQP
ncbi:hypothetical protein LINPERPRIM_LOCUS6943, partial [Linum perenne]